MFIGKCTKFIKVLLLLTVIVSICVFYVWVYQKTIVDRLDNSIISTYVSYFQAKLDECKQLLNINSSAGIESLEKFLEEVEDIKKQDRLDPLKRQAFELLANALRNKGDNIEALKWAEEWSSFDERDLYAQVLQATTMMRIPARHKEGQDSLDILCQKIPEVKNFPEVKVAIERNVNLLLEDELYTEAFLLMERFKYPFHRKRWEIFWDTGNGFNGSEWVRIIPKYSTDNIMRMKLNIPRGTQRIRIDPPEFLPLIITDPKMVRVVRDMKWVLAVAELPIGSQQIRQNGKIFQTSGQNDPFFYWGLPASLVSNEENIWDFTARVDMPLPSGFSRLSTPKIAEIVKAKLLERGDNSSFQNFVKLLYRQVHVQSTPDLIGFRKLRLGSLELFWRQDNDSFAAIRKKSAEIVVGGGDIQFAEKFAIHSTAVQLRIDFPEIQAAEYLITSISLLSNGSRFQFPLNAITPAYMHNLDKVGDVFRVVGTDPHFAVHVPDAFRAIDFVSIQGVAR